MDRDGIITQHYLNNYDRLVKRTINRVPNRSVALAEECVQEAYARAMKYFKAFDPERDKFEKWFEGILRNAVNDCRNDEKDRGVSKELSDDDGVEFNYSRQEKLSAIILLRNMKESRNKRILSLFLLYNFKTKEISQYTGVNHNAVRQIISRWRNDMNVVINKYN